MKSEHWLEVTWVRNSWESSRELMESWVGMKRDCLVRQSTITNIAVCPSNVRSCSMKSIEMDSHGHGGIGSCLRKPYGFLKQLPIPPDRKSTRLNSSHQIISYAVFCLKKKKDT